MIQIGTIPVINAPIHYDESSGKVLFGGCDTGLDVLKTTVQLSQQDLDSLAAKLSTQVDGGSF